MEKQLHEAFVLACPELTEISGGCEILVKYGGMKRKAVIVTEKSKGTFSNAFGSWVLRFTDADDPLFTFNTVRTITRREMTDVIVKGDVLGHPIRLSHVLRALENSDKKLRSGSWVTTTKWLCFYEAVTDNELCSYDLTTDSLSEQSPEFKSWLHSILCV